MQPAWIIPLSHSFNFILAIFGVGILFGELAKSLLDIGPIALAVGVLMIFLGANDYLVLRKSRDERRRIDHENGVSAIRCFLLNYGMACLLTFMMTLPCLLIARELFGVMLKAQEEILPILIVSSFVFLERITP